MGCTQKTHVGICIMDMEAVAGVVWESASIQTNIPLIYVIRNEGR